MLGNVFLVFGFLIKFNNVQAFGLTNVISPRQTTQGCKALHIIAARGTSSGSTVGSPSTWQGGEGAVTSISQAICDEISDCDSYGIIYPAASSPYKQSVSDGTKVMLQDIQEYFTSCPNSAIVLIGNSQGAQVVGNVVCGISESGYTASNPISGLAANNIIAVVQMADPSFRVGQSWNNGTATSNGVSARVNTAACQPFASRMISDCDKNDKYCASGNSMEVHQSYAKTYGKDIQEWVINKLKSSRFVSKSPYAKVATSTALTGKSSSNTHTSTKIQTLPTVKTTSTSIPKLASATGHIVTMTANVKIAELRQTGSSSIIRTKTTTSSSPTVAPTLSRATTSRRVEPILAAVKSLNDTQSLTRPLAKAHASKDVYNNAENHTEGNKVHTVTVTSHISVCTWTSKS